MNIVYLKNVYFLNLLIRIIFKIRHLAGTQTNTNTDCKLFLKIYLNKVEFVLLLSDQKRLIAKQKEDVWEGNI